VASKCTIRRRRTIRAAQCTGAGDYPGAREVFGRASGGGARSGVEAFGSHPLPAQSGTLFRRDWAAGAPDERPTGSPVDEIDIRLRRTAIGAQPRRLQPLQAPDSCGAQRLHKHPVNASLPIRKLWSAPSAPIFSVKDLSRGDDREVKNRDVGGEHESVTRSPYLLRLVRLHRQACP